MRTSVIIATYNYGRFVREAIRSVQEQTVEELEIIVVDDGSTDGTPEILDRIHDPRLRVYRIPNSGVSVARNVGLAKAGGEYITFLDADDRWRPTKLERQLAMMESEPELGLCFTNFFQFDEAGYFPRPHFDVIPDLSTLPSRPSRGGDGRVIEGDPFILMVPRYQLPVWPPTLMLRAERVRGVNFPPGVRVGEDLHYVMRVLQRVRAGYIEEPLVDVRRHGNNSYSTFFELREAGLRVYGALEGESMSPQHREALWRRTGRAWLEVSYHQFHARCPRASGQAALRALRYPGSRARAIKRLMLLPAMPLLAEPERSEWAPRNPIT